MAKPKGKPTFFSNKGPTYLIVMLYPIYILMKVTAIIIGIYGLHVLNHIFKNDAPQLRNQLFRVMFHYDTLNHYVARIFVVCAIVFSVWIYRANKNARFLGATDLEFTPGLAVGSFYVPPYFFYWPFFVVREIWKTAFSESTDWRKTATPAIIPIWWLLFLTMMIGYQLCKILKPESMLDLYNFLTCTIIYQTAAAGSAMLLMIITFLIFKKQLERKAAQKP